MEIAMSLLKEIVMDRKHQMAKIAKALSVASYVHSHQNILEMFALKGIYPNQIDHSLNLDLGSSSGIIEAYLVGMRWDRECK
jgi:hypothetical protein